MVPQGRVSAQGRTGLFDDIVGRGFVLLTTDDPRPALGEDRWSFLSALDTHVVRLLPSGAAGDTGHGLTDVLDVDGFYGAYLAEHHATAVLIRPDYHVFGTAHGPEDTAALVDALRDGLGAAVPVGGLRRAG